VVVDPFVEPDARAMPCPAALDSVLAQKFEIEPTEKQQIVTILNKMVARSQFRYEVGQEEDGDVRFTIFGDDPKPSRIFFLFSDQGELLNSYVDF
jgi:hypothetical protein